MSAVAKQRTTDQNNRAKWDELLAAWQADREKIAQGGGEKAIQRQHEKNRLTARERIDRLIDPGAEFLEIGRFAAWGMYEEWGGAPSASVICGIARVANRRFMVIANDATVKAGAFFPMTCKKVLRAQRIALVNRLPLIYLVDSAGVFLPLQEEIFPDEDDFGRIFRNNAVISALGIPQLAAIMGNCVAGGGYLPVLCDKLLMTEGSGLYLAGPALVKSAIGQDVEHEELGGAAMHAAISGTIDFREPDEEACLARLRELCDTIPPDRTAEVYLASGRREPAGNSHNQSASTTDPSLSQSIPVSGGNHQGADAPRSPGDIYDVFPANPQAQYEVRDVISCIVDADSFHEYKAEFGKTVVCGYAKLGGFRVGIVANQHHPEKTPKEGLQYGGVIYHDSADKM
ncbi:MAG: carboxyl transferase domain-containing protein, partial [Planctomycetaceae bacterium]